ncbi:MAG: histidine kinase [Bacteroidia bacterium]|nr:histidine kinase [Bacteroidia bacterium]
MGVIWFQAREGVGWFDGDEARIVSDKLPSRLSSPESGKLWFVFPGQWGTIQSPANLTYGHPKLPESISQIASNPTHLNLYIGNSVLYQMDMEGLDSISLPFIDYGIKELNSLFPLSQKQLLLGADNGFFLLNDQKLLPIGKEKKCPEFTCAVEISGSGQSEILIGTENGLIRFSKSGETYESIPTILEGEAISSLLVDSEGSIWVGTQENGIHYFYGKDFQQEIILKNDPCNPNSLPGNKITDLYQAPDGLIWITTNEGVVTFDYQKAAFNFTHFADCNPVLELRDVVGVLEDDQESLWLVRQDGLQDIRKDHLFGEVSPCKNLEGGLRPLLSGEGCRNGCFWVGTGDKGGSLICFDPRSRQFSQEVILGKGHEYYPTVLQEDAETGNLWIGTKGNGIFIMDANTRKITKPYSPDLEDKDALLNGNVNGIYQDSKGRIWVMTRQGGLHHLRDNGKGFKRFIIGPEPGTPGSWAVNCMVERMPDNYLVGISGIGLLRLYYNGTQFASSLISKEIQGLLSNEIKSLLKDNEGNVWAASDLGLTRLSFDERDSLEVVNFDQYDGLQPGEFAGGAALLRANGNLVFGGQEGINDFDPREIEYDSHPKVPVLIKSAQVLGQSEKSSYSISFPDPKSIIKLPHDQNNISFSFQAINYRTPDKVYYQYQLKGQEPQPVCSTEPKEMYVNLASGKYSFAIRAFANRGGNGPALALDETFERIKLKVNPIFYQNLLFQIFAIFAALGLGGAIVVRQVKVRQQKKEQELARQLAEKRAESAELENRKMELERLLADSKFKALGGRLDAHFTKNALYSLQGIVLNEEKIKAADSLAKLSKMIKLSMVLSEEVVIPLETEIEYLELYLKMEILRFGEKIKYRIDTTQAGKYPWSVPPMIIQIYVENAIKHGISSRKEGGTVTVLFEEFGDMLKCTIDDDGTGRKVKGEGGTHGMGLAEERLSMLNRLTGANINPEIIDKKDPRGKSLGTTVIIYFPKTYNLSKS